MKNKKIKRIRKMITKNLKTEVEKGLNFYLKKEQIKILMSYIKSDSTNILILGKEKQILDFFYHFFKKIENEEWRSVFTYKNNDFSIINSVDISFSDFADFSSYLAAIKRLSPEIIVVKNLNKKSMELSNYLKLIKSAHKFGIAGFENINNNIDITTELKKEILSTFNIIINLNENTKYKRIKKVKFENSEKEDFSIETLFY